MSRLVDAPASIREAYSRKAAADFPARVAVLRLQEGGYRSATVWNAPRYGRYTVMTTRDAESEDDFRRMNQWPQIRAVGPMSRLLFPQTIESDKDLREAAARMQADVLLLYTFETTFRVQDHEVGPLNLIALGTLPNQEAKVVATASAVLIDVRTGYLYALAEATAEESQRSSIWSSDSAVDASRLRAEREAFMRLVDELEIAWRGVVREHVPGETS